MKIKMKLKAGAILGNHNEKLVRSTGVKIKSRIRAGSLSSNHNERLVRAR